MVKQDFSTPDLVNQTVNQRYSIERELEASSICLTYRALDLQTQNHVAFKVFNPDIKALNPNAQAWSNDLELVSQWQHYNFFPVLDIGIINECIFLVEPLITQETLEGKLKAGSISSKEAIQISMQLLSILEPLHQNGKYHLNLKPSNIILVPGAFGQTQVILAGSGSHHLFNFEQAQQGLCKAAYGYMVPELIQGQTPQVASDIYLVGILLYEMLTGRNPLGDKSVKVAARKHLNHKPTSPKLLNPRAKISKTLNDLILSCLLKDPTQRPQSTTELAKTLESLLATSNHISQTIAPLFTPPPEEYELEKQDHDPLSIETHKSAGKSTPNTIQFVGSVKDIVLNEEYGQKTENSPRMSQEMKSLNEPAKSQAQLSTALDFKSHESNKKNMTGPTQYPSESQSHINIDSLVNPPISEDDGVDWFVDDPDQLAMFAEKKKDYLFLKVVFIFGVLASLVVLYLQYTGKPSPKEQILENIELKKTAANQSQKSQKIDAVQAELPKDQENSNTQTVENANLPEKNAEETDSSGTDKATSDPAAAETAAAETAATETAAAEKAAAEKAAAEKAAAEKAAAEKAAAEKAAAEKAAKKKTRSSKKAKYNSKISQASKAIKAKNYTKAKADIKSALKFQKGWKAYALLGDISYKEKKYDTAISHYKKSLKFYSRNAQVWFDLGKIQYKNKKYVDAEKSWDRSVKYAKGSLKKKAQKYLKKAKAKNGK